MYYLVVLVVLFSLCIRYTHRYLDRLRWNYSGQEGEIRTSDSMRIRLCFSLKERSIIFLTQGRVTMKKVIKPGLTSHQLPHLTSHTVQTYKKIPQPMGK